MFMFSQVPLGLLPAGSASTLSSTKRLTFSPERLPDAFPSYYASLAGFYDPAEHLVGKHPEHINARGGQMATPLVAVLHGKHFKIAELLHQSGADVDVRDSVEDMPLREACMAGVLDTVQWLLNHGADASALGCRNWPPLVTAAHKGYLEEVQTLIEHNADIHIRNHTEMTPFAAGLRDHVIMQILLDHGANPNARDYNDSTPLHHVSSSRGGAVEGAHLLLVLPRLG
jgi:uncharacterized protein